MEKSSHFALLAELLGGYFWSNFPSKWTQNSSHPQSCGETFPTTVKSPFCPNFRVWLTVPVISALASLMFVMPVVLLASEPAKPNILFAIADDWSFGHAGVYGCKWVKTPTMDRVARDGILFTQITDCP